MAKARWTWLVVAAALAGVAGCEDGGKDPDGNTPDAGGTASGAQPGFGKDRRQPTGKPLTLPAGVQVVSGTLPGADDDGRCGDPELEPVGSGFMVRACLEMTNTTGGPVQVTFPPGLVIVSTSETYQNGMLVERVVVEVPPTPPGPGGADAGTPDPVPVKIPLHLYCINENAGPSAPSVRYTLGPVTDHPQMREVFTFLEGKDVAGDGNRVEVVQEAIYSITEDSGLTEDDRAALRDL
ncbi:hypothetical protein [Myxococcus sp. RHSTA-1-4]|uniref:hypothetical protein n=1 Tax=Myxococcus sp. RHSTA-1-4 TaxID=2874601 RepID=UPI001CBE9E8F|nr:hypothetical protein [Myxococcus sp. RHSTA-1-4]MBZ4417739.1 hypothetical protein [Myxococcus sp. RHSTA-1-4]